MGKPLTIKRVERFVGAAMGRYQRLMTRHRVAYYSKDPDIVALIHRHRAYAHRWQRFYLWLETLAADEHDRCKAKFPHYSPPQGVTWADITLARLRDNNPPDTYPIATVPGLVSLWSRPLACMAD